MAASYTLSNITENSVQINLTPDSSYTYYTIVCRLTSDTSDATYYKNHHKDDFPVTVTGLKASTGYTTNVGYNNTGNLAVEGYIGAQTFTTSAAATKYYVKLVYNANGGSGTPSTTTHSDTDRYVSCTISPMEPTRSGYEFLGWSTSSTATSASYQPSTAYNFTANTTSTSITAARTYTLYAVWKQLRYYAKLVYNANGGSGAPSASTKNSTSSNISFTISSSKPTRSGFTFLGWSVFSTATSASFDPGDTYTIRSSSTSSSSPTTSTLYAVWATAYYARVSFNANGGSGAPSSISAIGTSSWVSITLPDTEPTRSGATFLGWSESSDATDPDYLSGVSYVFYATTSTYYTTTLYAVWYYDEYGVEITYVDRVYEGGGYTTDVTRYYDTDANVSVTMPNALQSADGYIFLGWSTSSTATVPDYLPGSTYNFTGKLETWNSYTLYSVWQAVYTVQITFNANNGSGAPPSQTYTDSDSEVSCAFPSTIPVRDGYTFLGWAYSSSATSPSYYASGTYNLTGSIAGTSYTFYAVWLRNKLAGVVKIDTQYYHPYICHGGAFKMFVPYVCRGSWKTTTEGS